MLEIIHQEGNNRGHSIYDKWISDQITALKNEFETNPAEAFDQLMNIIGTTRTKIVNEIIGKSDEIVLDGLGG